MSNNKIKDYPLKKSKYYTDLYGEVDKIDKEHFGGKLKGKVDYAWTKTLVDAGGITNSTRFDHKVRVRPLILLSKESHRAEGDKRIRGTLAHEMVHAYQGIKGNDDGHGKNFRAKIGKINRQIDEEKKSYNHLAVVGEHLKPATVDLNYRKTHNFARNTASGSVISTVKGVSISDDHPQYEGEGTYKRVEHNNYADFKKMMSNKLPVPAIRLKPLNQFAPSEKIKEQVKQTSDLKEFAINQWTNRFKSYLADVKGTQLQMEKPTLKLLKEEREAYNLHSEDFKINVIDKFEEKKAKKYAKWEKDYWSEKGTDKIVASMENYKGKYEDDPVRVTVPESFDRDKRRLFQLAPMPNKIVKNPLTNGKGFLSNEDATFHATQSLTAMIKAESNPKYLDYAGLKSSRHSDKINELEDRISKGQKRQKYLDLARDQFHPDDIKKISKVIQNDDKGSIKRSKSGLKQDLSKNDYYRTMVSGPGKNAQRRENERTQNAVDLQYVIKSLEEQQKKVIVPAPQKKVTGQKRRAPPRSVISDIIETKKTKKEE